MFKLFRKDRRKPEEQPAVNAGLEFTRKQLDNRLLDAIANAARIDESLYEAIESALITSDFGVAAALEIVDRLRAAVDNKVIATPAEMVPAVQAELFEMIEPCEQLLEVDPKDGPFVILMVGVNGAGKTTTIGKLARRLKEDGLSVMLAAGDTFRAAAVEQLRAWGERNDVPVIAQGTGADSAAVIYDALESAKAKGLDVLIADTAGRLHTQSNLMEELKKIKRVIGRLDESAPHEIMLVVDAGTGQNAINQARQFNEAVGLTGITITKLDGTARGGILFAIAHELRIPIRFIGVGEKSEDLRPFDAGSFIHAILPVS
jgi:fused signal recognition particle receptor